MYTRFLFWELSVHRSKERCNFTSVCSIHPLVMKNVAATKVTGYRLGGLGYISERNYNFLRFLYLYEQYIMCSICLLSVYKYQNNILISKYETSFLCRKVQVYIDQQRIN